MKLIVKTSATFALGIGLLGIGSYLFYLLLRKDEDDDYSDTLVRAQHFKTLEIPIPKDMVKIIIGRNGRNIKQLQDQSNTKINFLEHDNRTSICLVKGSIDSCSIAENLIRQLINHEAVMECEDIWVPTGSVSRIIGSQGDHISELTAKSGAHITVDSNRNANPRRITLKGTKEQINVAKSLIEEIVDKYQKSQAQINETLAKREPRLPPRSNGESPKSIGSPKVERISPVPGQPDAQFEVYISAMVDPSRFWLQIVGPKATQLDLLVEEMTDYYKKDENRELHSLNRVEKGDLVAAVFQYDGKWYRAEVLNVLNDTNEIRAELYYVDYGDTDVVPIDELFELRTDFLRLHFQAIECFLARVDPVGEEWSVEAVDKFEEWTHVAQWKKLSAKINGYSSREKTRAKREGSPVPGVDLFDVNNEQDVDIAQELVNHGYAVFKRDAELKSSRATSTSNISVASSS